MSASTNSPQTNPLPKYVSIYPAIRLWLAPSIELRCSRVNYQRISLPTNLFETSLGQAQGQFGGTQRLLVFE